MLDTLLHGAFGKFKLIIAGQNDEFRIEALAADVPDQIDSVHDRHADICHHNIRPLTADYLERFHRAGAHPAELRMVRFPRHNFLHRIQDNFLIVNQ